jgi:PKD domain
MRPMQKRRCQAALLTTIAFATACTVHQTEVPPLAGPSELAQAMLITATPDTINVGPLNSASGDASTIAIRVFDASGKGQSGQTVRLQAVPSGCGQLAPLTLTTDSSGRATAVYTAPGQPLPQPECAGFPSVVDVVATPVGTNFQTSVSHTASIHMVVPAIVQAPGAGSVNFTIAPPTAKVSEEVTFSDAGSTGSVGCSAMLFQWYFSDGITKTGASVQHDFVPAGTYTATLVVTDSCGNQSAKSASIAITP